jgi:serine-type D-Ala-D-Ala carboxypeptidase/endopeptidase (penicillin-binding protein 4)
MTALRAGQPATFEGGTAVVREVLSRRYGVSLENFEMYDGSGLYRANRIPARTLTLGPEWGRFDDENSKCAVGKVHAKTGTLTGAIALSCLTQGKDGRRKVFSFVENGSTAKAAPSGTRWTASPRP